MCKVQSAKPSISFVDCFYIGLLTNERKRIIHLKSKPVPVLCRVFRVCITRVMGLDFTIILLLPHTTVTRSHYLPISHGFSKLRTIHNTHAIRTTEPMNSKPKANGDKILRDSWVCSGFEDDSVVLFFI